MKEEYYILEGKTTQPVNFLTWIMWFEKADRQIFRDTFGNIIVSTIFLGLDYNWGEGELLLFETIILGGELDGERQRYSTYEEAEKGHEAMVESVKDELILEAEIIY